MMIARGWRKRRINMKQPLDILEQMKNALDDAYVAGVRNAIRPWQGLTLKDWEYLDENCGSIRSAVKTAETLLKEKNGYA